MAIASWARGLAVPMPRPCPGDADAASVHTTAATMGIAARAARDTASHMHDNVMTISCANELQKIRRQSTPVLSTQVKMLAGKTERGRRISIHLCGAVIHLTFVSLTSACDLRRGDAAYATRAVRRRRDIRGPKETAYAGDESSGACRRWRIARPGRSGRARPSAVAQQSRRRRGGPAGW